MLYFYVKTPCLQGERSRVRLLSCNYYLIVKTMHRSNKQRSLTRLVAIVAPGNEVITSSSSENMTSQPAVSEWRDSIGSAFHRTVSSLTLLSVYEKHAFTKETYPYVAKWCRTSMEVDHPSQYLHYTFINMHFWNYWNWHA